MTDQRPEVSWQPGDGPLGATEGGPEMLWWEQPFHGRPRTWCVWVAAPARLWEHAGTITLKAAGLETVGAGRGAQHVVRNSRPVAGRDGAVDRRRCSAAKSLATPAWSARPIAKSAAGRRSRMRFPGRDAAAAGDRVRRRGCFRCSRRRRQPEPEHREPESRAAAGRRARGDSLPRSRTMELLLDVDLPVSISFGKTQVPLKDVLKLTTGSIVELNRGVNDQVEVLVNQCLIARGEVVVVEGNYGVRIQEIASRQDRLRSLR